MARQRGTSGRWVGSSGRSEAVGAMLRGELGAGGGSESGSRRGSPYNHPPSRRASGGKGLSGRLEHRCGAGLPVSWCGTPLPSLGRG